MKLELGFERAGRQGVVAIGAALLLVGISGAAAADDVTVGSTDPNGKLTINGDPDGNDITITEAANGDITITGNGTTTVNGMGSVTIKQPPTVKTFEIKLRGGDDSVKLDGVSVDDVKVSDKIGDNTTTVEGSTIKNVLKIKHGPGDDTINVKDTTRGEDKINPGKGRNDVNVEGGSSQQSRLNTQAGDDHVSFDGTAIGDLKLNTGPGDDDVFVSDSWFGRSSFQGAAGENCLAESGENVFAYEPRIRNFDSEECNGGGEESGRAVTLDFDTGEIPAGTLVCLDEVVAGGCVFTGPECLDGGSPAPHLHDATAFESMPDEFFEDPNPGGCGHGIVESDVLGCGPDDVPGCT